MSESPRPPSSGSGLPARRLGTEQIEAVVRRAIELQTHEADTSAAGVSDEELVRIGGELGIAPAHMRRALAEVTAHAPSEPGGGLLGPARTSASRAVPGNPDTVRQHIEKYLLDSEYLAVLRRLPDRTIYEKSGGLHVEMARVMDKTRIVVSGHKPGRRIGAGFDLRTASSVEVSVTQMDERISWVNLTVDLSSQRTAYWLGINSGVGVGAFIAGLSAATVFAPPAALVALPIMAASAWGTRVTYRALVKRARLHLEALLDHLERGESLLNEYR